MSFIISISLRYIISVLIAATVIFFSIGLSNASGKNLSLLIKQAEKLQLANHPYWYKLLHYKKNTFSSKTNFSSEIISSGFFLSPKGSENPEAELKETLSALLKQSKVNPDSHAQCRFIARFKWLRRKLDWTGIDIPKVSCSKFNKWSRNNQINSMSLIFATGYLSNPASYFGHVLLKFNSNRDINSTSLLDESLNFGANIPENENGFKYLFKGLFGGYEAGFTAKKFYKLNHAYIENDLRDLWEYKLNFSKHELNQIVYHSWELLGVSYDYYFLKENCAYRMAELLNLVVEEPLLPDYFWSNPVTVFENLIKINRHSHPIVQEVIRIPSRQNKFYEKYLKLSKTNQLLLGKKIVGKKNKLSKKYISLSDNDKIKIVDTLIDYYEFLIISDKKNKALVEQKQKYLLERATLPIENNFNGIITENNNKIQPPHGGPLPMMFRMGSIYNTKFKNGIQLEYRPVYYDMLELDNGRIPNSSLTVFDIKVAYIKDRLKLQNIDFIKVETLNVARTPLPDDSEIAWNFKFSVQRHNLACDHCLVTNISGGVGKAGTLTPTNNFVVFGMVDTFVNSNYNDSGTIGIAPRIGIIASYSSWLKTYISFKYNKFLNGSQLGENQILWETRFGSNRNWDIRLNYEKHVAREYLAKISIYW